ncbi:MAG: HIT family protein [Candidatus Edwardsbacteria bacterium]
MPDCVFCRIVNDTEPASVLYSDEKVMAFMDIRPVNPGHVLVIPKIHTAYISELDEEMGTHLFRITMRIAEAVRKSGVRCDGINLFVADGEAAFQEVFHFHLHIIPRFKRDGFELKFGPNNLLKSNREELNRIATRIRRKLEK